MQWLQDESGSVQTYFDGENSFLSVRMDMIRFIFLDTSTVICRVLAVAHPCLHTRNAGP